MKYIMKNNGSVKGKSGRRYHFNTGQEIEAPEGEFSSYYADEVKEEKPVKAKAERASKKTGEKATK